MQSDETPWPHAHPGPLYAPVSRVCGGCASGDRSTTQVRSGRPAPESRLALLLDAGIHVAGLQDVIGVGADAEIIHVIGDIHPAVRHAERDDDDIARHYRTLGHVADD